jgi:hypothetical protein
MREGMGLERGVWFAGEHTAEFVAVGTTVGAYWSGDEVAGRVCRILFGTGQEEAVEEKGGLSQAAAGPSDFVQ